MKTMTCRALGGPCDLEHHGESADDVIKAQDRHLKEAEKAGDATPQKARDAMKSRWRHPKKSMGWYNDTKRPSQPSPTTDRSRSSVTPRGTDPERDGHRRGDAARAAPPTSSRDASYRIRGAHWRVGGEQSPAGCYRMLCLRSTVMIQPTTVTVRRA